MHEENQTKVWLVLSLAFNIFEHLLFCRNITEKTTKKIHVERDLFPMFIDCLKFTYVYL